MNKIFAISRLTVLLNMRQGAFWGNVFLIPAVFAAVFFVVTSGGTVENDIEIKSQYAFTAAYSLLTLSILATACFTVRSQLDQRNFHLLSSYPIDRKHIWFGQFLGLTFLAVISEIVLLTCFWSCQTFFVSQLNDKEQDKARTFLSQPQVKVKPRQPSLEELTHRRIQEDNVPVETIDQRKWKSIYYKVKGDDFRLYPGTQKNYNFDLDGRPPNGIRLNYRLDSSKHKILIKGRFELKGINQAVYHDYPIEFYPLQSYTINIPAEDLPADGQFRITFTNQDSHFVHLKRERGLFISYDQGHYSANIIKTLLTHACHLAITIVVGMTAGVCLSFPVAVFISLLLYGLSLCAEFFLKNARIQSGGYNVSFYDQVTDFILVAGMWICKGLQPPGVIASMSRSADISMADIVTNWLPGNLGYGIVIMLIGAFILDRKELERIQV